MTNDPPTPRTRPTRRSIVAVAAPMLFVLAALAGLQLSASADSAQSDVAASCALGTSSLDVTVPMTVEDVVDPIEEGASQTLHTESGLPTMPVVVTINELVVTTPIPDQVASTDAVTFSGGNMAASYEIVGSDLVVTFTGPVQSDAIDIPKVTAEQTLKDGIAPTTIDWKVFSSIVADPTYGVATCTPNDPNQVLNSTEVVAGGPVTPPTEPPTEPTEPPTEPTEPPTEPTEPPTTPPTEPPTEPTEPPTEPTEPPTEPTEPPAPAPDPCPALPSLPAPPLPVPGAPGVPELPALCPPDLGGGVDGGVGIEVEVELKANIQL
jgi:hypothetical protein